MRTELGPKKRDLNLVCAVIRFKGNGKSILFHLIMFALLKERIQIVKLAFVKRKTIKEVKINKLTMPKPHRKSRTAVQDEA